MPAAHDTGEEEMRKTRNKKSVRSAWSFGLPTHFALHSPGIIESAMITILISVQNKTVGPVDSEDVNLNRKTV